MICIYDAFSSFIAFNHFPNFFFKYILVVLNLVRSESVRCIVLIRARSGGQCGQGGQGKAFVKGYVKLLRISGQNVSWGYFAWGLAEVS